MSKKVDERVVSMQFDNAQFERNVATSMSTLDKLKQKLNFKGMSKGLENVNSAAKNVNFSSMANSVDTVRMRFSALEVAGVTALANITNSAINAGKNIVKALTLDPVMDGFREYELNMNSVQTILANTQSKGTTIDDVNSALDELNEYADQTIYNFAEMTRNIGTFTAAGVDLDKSVTSIKGIANLAAISGSNSQQAATAMYQLSQALAAGKVSLMDWNSVVNAGMGGEVFQNALKRTAENFGTDVDAMIEKYGSFRESLTEGGWLTAEVLTETLTQLSGAYTEADLIAQGYTESQAKEILQLADTALSAATDIKTFTGLMDTLKESVGSGWAKTWQIIFGDFEESKQLWSSVGEVVTGMVDKISDARNNLLEGAFSSKWNDFSEKLKEAGVSTDEFQQKLTEVANTHGVSIDKMIEEEGSLKNAIDKGKVSKDLLIETLKTMAGMQEEAGKSTEDMTAKLEEFQKVVHDVWMGDYKNGEERVKALTDAGYNYAEVQALVNKTVDGHKLTLEDLSDTQLQAVGYTNEEIEALRKLAEEAEKTGTPLNELIEDMSKPTGRTLFLESISNLLQPISTILKAIGEAWRDAFPPMTSDTLYGIIEAFHGFTEALVIGDDTANNLTRTLKGVFAILDIITTIVGGGFKIAFGIASKVVTTLWEALGFGTANILEITAAVGDGIVAFRNWFESINPVSKAIEIIVPLLVNLVKGIAGFAKSLYDLPAVQNVISKIADGFKSLGDAIGSITPEKVINGLLSLKDTIVDAFSNLDGLLGGIPANIIDGLANGIRSGVSNVAEAMSNIAETILNTIKSILGIHSPSTAMEEVGNNVILGLFNGLKNGVSMIASVIGEIASSIIDFLGNIDWGTVLAGGIAVGSVIAAKRILDIFDAFAAPMEGLGSIFEGVGSVIEESAKPIAKVITNVSKVVKSFAGVLNAKAWQMRADALFTIAKGIALLAASLFLISKVDPDRLLASFAALAGLAVILTGLSFAMSKVDLTGMATGKLAAMLLSMGIAITLIGSTVKKLGDMDQDQINKAFAALAGIVVAMAGIMAAFGKFTSDAQSANIGKLGSMMLKMSVALLLMVAVVKLIGMLTVGELIKGGIAITAFVGIVGLLAKVTQIGQDKQIAKLGGLLLSMSVSLILMVSVVKLIGMLSAGELIKGGIAITAFVGIIGLLTKVTKIGQDKQIAKLGGLLMSVSVSLLFMVAAVKLIGMLSVGEMVKGGIAILAFVGIIKLLVEIVKIGPEQEIAKVASTILAMSVAIGIMAAIAVVLSLVDLAGLAKGIVAVGLLGSILALMIHATKGANDVKGNLIAMTVAIGIMALAVAALSFIEPSKLAGATAAITIMMATFGLMAKLSGQMQSSMKSIIMMVGVVALLTGVVYALSMLDMDSALTNVASLSLLMATFSASLFAISKAGNVSAKALIGIGIMSLVMAELVGILYALQALDINASMSNVAALSVLLTTFSAAIFIIGKSGHISVQALAAMGVMTLVMAALTGILYAIEALDINASMTNVAALSTMLIAMSAACAIISFIPAAGAIQGALGLSAFVGIMGAVLTALGGLSKIPGVSDLINSGGQLLSDIGLAIGGFVGSIIGGIGSGISAGFPEIASNLSLFMDNLQPFLDGASKIDPSVMDGVQSLAVAILALTGANLLDGINDFMSFLTGGNSLDEFGSELASFGKHIKTFSDNVSGIDEGAVTAAANAGKMLAEMAKTIPNSGGLLGDILGNNDVDEFGEKLKTFGQAMCDFSNTIVNNGGISEEAVTAAANAGKMMAELAENIPNDGGIWGSIFGDNDIDDFGKKLKSFGESITEFSSSVSVDESAVESAANAGKIMAEMQKAIPEDHWFDGKMSIDDFGKKIVTFGKKMTEYSDSVTGLDTSSIDTSVTSANKIIVIAQRLAEVDMTQLSNFKVDSLGDSIRKYADKVAGIDSSSVSTSISIVQRLIAMINSMAGLDTSGVNGFKAAISSLGQTEISSFVSAFSKSSSSLGSVGTMMINAIVNGLNSGKGSLASQAASIVNILVDGIRSRQGLFTEVATGLMNRFVTGIASQASRVMAAITAMLSVAISSAQGFYGSFYNAGAYLVAGFANGISANSYMAAARARAMASAAASAARAALDEHSPSKVFYKIGDFAGLGFVNALGDYENKSYKAGAGMADYARKGISKAINKINTMFTDDIDAQPTIRPVLDLSDVQSGVGRIGNMFGDNISIGMSPNIGVISSSMNRKRQNGTNDDVISAIKDLKKSIGRTSGDTYNINGVTYDDGSNVSSAVQTLIRAARIERRA